MAEGNHMNLNSSNKPYWSLDSSLVNEHDEQGVWHKMAPGVFGGRYGRQVKSHRFHPKDTQSNYLKASSADKDNNKERSNKTETEKKPYADEGVSCIKSDLGGNQCVCYPNFNDYDYQNGNASHTKDHNVLDNSIISNLKPKPSEEIHRIQKHRRRKTIQCCHTNLSPIEQKEWEFLSPPQQKKSTRSTKHSKESYKQPCIEYVMCMPTDQERHKKSDVMNITLENNANDNEIKKTASLQPTELSGKQYDSLSVSTHNVSIDANSLDDKTKMTGGNGSTSNTMPNTDIYDKEKEDLKPTHNISPKCKTTAEKKRRFYSTHEKASTQNYNQMNRKKAPIFSSTKRSNKTPHSSSPVSMLTQEILEHTTVDKSVHLRYFQQSMAGQNFVCRSNSLVELTGAQLEDARAAHNLPSTGKRRSLTLGQEGFFILGGETAEECLTESFHQQQHHNHHPPPHPHCESQDSGYYPPAASEIGNDIHHHINHEETISPENIYKYAHHHHDHNNHLNIHNSNESNNLSTHSPMVVNLRDLSMRIALDGSGECDIIEMNATEMHDTSCSSGNMRTTSIDWNEAEHDETGGLLDTDSCSEEDHQNSLSTKNSADQESGFHSQVSQV